jgi:hypothetical protein
MELIRGHTVDTLARVSMSLPGNETRSSSGESGRDRESLNEGCAGNSALCLRRRLVLGELGLLAT